MDNVAIMTNLSLAKITKDNVGAVCKLSVEPHQQSYVAPVVKSLAEAYAEYEVAWPRVIFDGEDMVGFVMAAFEPDCPIDYFRCGIWRLNIAAGNQGRGYGRFAVEAVLDEARRRNEKQATVLWAPGEHSPEAFYLKLGFRKTGVVHDGQHVGAIDL